MCYRSGRASRIQSAGFLTSDPSLSQSPPEHVEHYSESLLLLPASYQISSTGVTDPAPTSFPPTSDTTTTLAVRALPLSELRRCCTVSVQQILGIRTSYYYFVVLFRHVIGSGICLRPITRYSVTSIK